MDTTGDLIAILYRIFQKALKEVRRRPCGSWKPESSPSKFRERVMAVRRLSVRTDRVLPDEILERLQEQTVF